jgi:hypothetical protein
MNIYSVHHHVTEHSSFLLQRRWFDANMKTEGPPIVGCFLNTLEYAVRALE